MALLEVNQVHALAATLGHLEARMDIERIQGVKTLMGGGKTAAQLCYQALATAFELEGLIDESYLEAEPEVDVAVSEPCS